MKLCTCTNCGWVMNVGQGPNLGGWKKTLEQRPMQNEAARTVELNMPKVWMPSLTAESSAAESKWKVPDYSATPQERTIAFRMTAQELFSIGDFSEIVEAVMTMPNDFLDVLSEAQIAELVKAIPDKFLKAECFERGIEVNPFDLRA